MRVSALVVLAIAALGCAIMSAAAGWPLWVAVLLCAIHALAEHTPAKG